MACCIPLSFPSMVSLRPEIMVAAPSAGRVGPRCHGPAGRTTNTCSWGSLVPEKWNVAPKSWQFIMGKNTCLIHRKKKTDKNKETDSYTSLGSNLSLDYHFFGSKKQCLAEVMASEACPGSSVRSLSVALLLLVLQILAGRSEEMPMASGNWVFPKAVILQNGTMMVCRANCWSCR